MIKLLKKKKVVPKVDEYVSKRYEDTAVTIYFSIKEGKGLYCAFVPWMQSMLERYIPSDEARRKYWHDQVSLYNDTVPVHQAWAETINSEIVEISVNQNDFKSGRNQQNVQTRSKVCVIL